MSTSPGLRQPRTIILPNRKLFGTLYAVGIGAVSLAFASAIALGAWWWTELPNHTNRWGYGHRSSFTPQYFWICLMLLVAGVILLAWPGRIFRKYYRYVPRGRIVRKYTTGGGMSGLAWWISIEGYTLANELRLDTFEVDAGFWHERRIGSSVRRG